MSELTTDKVRIDKWLWAVRVFKTRSVSADTCNAGRVKIDGKSVKPAYQLKLGDTVTIQSGQERKVLKVLRLIEKRVGAPIALTCYEDQSPPPAVAPNKKSDSVFYIAPVAQRERGAGRPTKRDRRTIDSFRSSDDSDDSDDNLRSHNSTATTLPDDFAMFFDDDDDDDDE